MLEQLDLGKILFLDIETVSQYRDYIDMPERMQYLWGEKIRKVMGRTTPPEDIDPVQEYPRAAIYAEFGKIVCICAGYIRNNEFRVKVFASHDERQLLDEFGTMLTQSFSGPQNLLCAHNGKEFDYPYISRRMLINGIKLPPVLQIAGRKPWEVAHLDTMELWKFGDFKNYTSLDVLTMAFDIPTPKDDISGADIHSVYYKEDDLDRIANYCIKDTFSVAQLMLRFQGKALIPLENVLVVP